MDTKKLLLKASDIATMLGEHKVHYLNPNAVRLNKSLGDAIGLNHLGVHIITLEPGSLSTEYHKHYYEEECVYVLSGCGTVTIEEDQYKIESGDFFGFPRGTAAHDIINDGEQPLVCLVIGQRLEQDVADYPRQGKRLYRNSGEWNLVHINHIINPKKK